MHIYNIICIFMLVNDFFYPYIPHRKGNYNFLYENKNAVFIIQRLKIYNSGCLTLTLNICSRKKI